MFVLLYERFSSGMLLMNVMYNTVRRQDFHEVSFPRVQVLGQSDEHECRKATIMCNRTGCSCGKGREPDTRASE